MSETDDTDTLLLIPPNFFLVSSDQESDTDLERSTDRIIVGKLISHVNNLENRINNIENFAVTRCPTPLSDFDNRSSLLNDIDRGENVSDRSGSSVLENITALKQQSDALDVNDSTFNNLNKVTLLGEIDSFLDNKFSSQCENNMDQVSTLDALFQNGSPTKRLALPEVDKLLKEMEITQTEIENKLRMREIESGIIHTSDKNKHQSEIASRRIYTTGDNIGSIPDRGFGVRELFANNSQSSPNKSSNNNNSNSIEEPCVKRDAFLVGSSNGNDEFRKSLPSLPLTRSPLKDFTSPTKVNSSSQETRRKNYLSPRRRLQMISDNGNGKSTGRLELEDRAKLEFGGSGDIEEARFKPDGAYASKARTYSNPRSNLLSLADLWRSENDLNLEDPTKLKQKLEEEKYRRLHLENTVQTLQRRVLEEQEKLAVAVKVDEGKDRAIGQITGAWKQMVQHWKQIEAERHAMSQTLITERAEISKQREDIDKKITRWEKEMSQALDLAAGFKAKCEHLDKEFVLLRDSSEKRIKELEDTVVEQESSIEELKDERKSLADRLQLSKNEHEEEKRLVESLRRDISILQEQLSKSEAELIVVKEQRDLLTTRIKEEKSRSSMLDAQKSALTEALDIANEKLTKTEEDVKAITSTLEKSKAELRAVYQSQLESVVRDKVAEFQSQLDRAQTAMQIELENNRRKAEEIARSQQQALVNSHVVEMRRLESIHKEEMKILENKLLESERGRARLENGKKDIAQRLHGVMESQWRQALNIITSELSSVKQNDRGDVPTTAVPGTSRVGVLDDDHYKPNLTERNPSAIPPSRRRLSLKQNSDEVTPSTVVDSETISDDTPFNKDGQLTSRSNVPPIKQPQLLNYIQALLERQPGRPVDTTSSTVIGGQWPDTTTTDTVDEHVQHWAQVIQNNPVLLSGPSENLKQPPNLKKPPWKPT